MLAHVLVRFIHSLCGSGHTCTGAARQRSASGCGGRTPSRCPCGSLPPLRLRACEWFGRGGLPGQRSVYARIGRFSRGGGSAYFKQCGPVFGAGRPSSTRHRRLRAAPLAQPMAFEKVVKQHKPQQHRLDLPQPADKELLHATVAHPSIGPFRRGKALLENHLGLLALHPLPPGQHARRRRWKMAACGPWPRPRLCHWGIVRCLRIAHPKRLNIAMGHEAPIHNMFHRRAAIASLGLLHHRCRLTSVDDVDHLPTNHDPRLHIYIHLHVIGRAESAISHLHHPCFGIGARRPSRLIPFLAALRLALLDLFHMLQRSPQASRPLAPCPLPGCLLTSRRSGRVAFEFPRSDCT